MISELWVELETDIEVTSYSLDPDPAAEDLAVGDTLTAETVLANHGDRPGEFEVEYLVDEEVVANETVEVDADSTETVELTHELRESGTKTISVNGVDPVEIDVEGPEADIEVTSYTLDPNPAEDDVFVGDALAVEANLTNHGDKDGEFEVEYVVDEEVVNNETVEVGAGTTEIVELEHELRESGTKIVSVNGVDPVQITVESGVEPPAFELTDVYPGNHTVGPETVVAVGGNITNTGEEADSSTVELWVDDEMVATDSVTLEPGETSSVSWEIESSNETGEYTLTLSTASESVTHTLTVAVPDPIAGFAQPQDTTGDGLYDDVTGSGNTTIADVQALFDNLGNDSVQESAWAFDFAGVSADNVSIFDVQALFNRIQAEPATH